jgi:hypothetical protein
MHGASTSGRSYPHRCGRGKSGVAAAMARVDVVEGRNVTVLGSTHPAGSNVDKARKNVDKSPLMCITAPALGWLSCGGEEAEHRWKSVWISRGDCG